jgi:hypothetical protein
MQMDKRILKALIVASLVMVLGVLLAACGGSNQDSSGSLDGKTLVEERCTRCHGLETVTGASKTKEEWQTTVERMVGKGANLDAEEQEIVIDYLAETYGQ